MSAHAPELKAAIAAAVNNTLSRTALAVGSKYTGKVRDAYETPEHMLLVTTDRLSAFDRLLACVPYKGAVLNLTSAYWFSVTSHIIPNHVLSIPHPNVTVAKKCAPFKIEFVVRAYLTGSTSTSIWVHYKDGSRSYCGHALPDGECCGIGMSVCVCVCCPRMCCFQKYLLVASASAALDLVIIHPALRAGMIKSQKLPSVICTPTTKDDVHDRPISGAEVVSEGWMSQADWDYTSNKALELFMFGQELAATRGLILVDTKYEFGKTSDGTIHLIDEIHTPDSSRYWIADSYASRFAAGLEPENIDKEFLRIWFREHCDPYADATLPAAPPELVTELSRRYIMLFERITGQDFMPQLKVLDEGGPMRRQLGVATASHFPPAKLGRIVLVGQRALDSVGIEGVLACLPKPVTTQVGSPSGTDVDSWAVETRVAVEYYELLTAAAAGDLAAQLASDGESTGPAAGVSGTTATVSGTHGHDISRHTVVIVFSTHRKDELSGEFARLSNCPTLLYLGESPENPANDTVISSAGMVSIVPGARAAGAAALRILSTL